ncbi:MAG: hypothetical protein LBG07_04250 [Treponema sp.]|jgi:hypothetical protein|nr:hypothetical protein [Treponema sp.]
MRIGFSRSRRQGLVYPRLCRRFFAAILFSLPLFLSLFFSCAQKEEIRLAPPAMSPLSRGEIGYGVVNVSYTHVADEPGGQGLSLGYLRRGSVVRVLERRVPGGKDEAGGGSPETWVRAEGRDAGFDSLGWLPESVIDIYPTEAQARTASDSLLQ